MTLKGPEFKKALLLGLVVAATPLAYYPNGFGWPEAAFGSAPLFAAELLYYLLVFQFLMAREPFANRAKASALALGFRLGQGLVFALLAGGMFNVPAGEALRAGIYGYLPAALLQVALVPFLLQPVFRFRELRRPRAMQAPESQDKRPQRTSPSLAEAPVWAGAEAVPNFDAAVAHVATYSTVRLVLLVDEEGLCVARASRGAADSDLWAPVVNLLYNAVLGELRRTPDAFVRRLQLTLAHERLVIERVEPFYLAVLCDSGTDELVNVRITQAVEMVKRYYERNYPKAAHKGSAEVAYV
jgi:hypothetical protein